MTIHDEIAEFFVEYLDAFLRNDADALSELWDTIGLFPSPTGNLAMPRQAFRDHCVTLVDFYRQQGVVRPEGELLSADELFRDLAQARWHTGCFYNELIFDSPPSQSGFLNAARLVPTTLRRSGGISHCLKPAVAPSE